MIKSETTGLLLSMVCAIIWGASYPISAVLAGKIDPIVFSIARYGLAAVGLAIIFLLQKKKSWLQIKDIPNMAIAGVLGQAVLFYTTLLALEYISAAEVGVINGMISILTVLICIPIYRTMPTATQIIAVTISFLGAFCIAFDPSNKFTGINLGHLYALLGVLSIIASGFINKKFADRYDGVSSMFYQFMFATAALVIVMVVQGRDITQVSIIFKNGYYLSIVLILGLICSAFAYVIYFQALKLTGVQRANMAQNVLPLSAFTLAIFMVDEQITTQKVIGIVLVVSSLFLFDMKWDTIKIRFAKRSTR